jgi:uncharacterized YigZ family protein
MSYQSIAKIGTSLYKEKGSKFLGFAVSCNDESDVKRLVDAWRKEHPGACHVCFAFKLGYDGQHYRASDDGEPSNSAGQPILGQITAFGVTQVLVAVVRYYGGTKLGVGGLIQAYRTAAKLALEDAEIVEKEILARYNIACTYEQLPLVMKEIKTRHIEILHQKLDLQCTFEVVMKLELCEDWEAFLCFQHIKFERLE